MRKLCCLFILLIFSICVLGFGNAEIQEIAPCPHNWEKYDEAVHGTTQYKTELYKTDPDGHLYLGYYPECVCSLCGACEYDEGGGSYAYHAYKVTGCIYDDAGENVTLTWLCDLCGYERTECVSVQSIIEGTNGTCLLGGACNGQLTSRYMHEGIVLNGTMPAEWKGIEKEWFLAVIYNLENGGFLCTTRKYCLVCGRPKYDEWSRYEMFREDWNGLPIMTEDYFLTVGMPENMPYQLIEQIRSVSSTE